MRAFISYSRDDRTFVEGLSARLETSGVEAWLDTEEIGGGASWRAAISNAIRECDAFVVVLSPQAVASKNVAKEVSLADGHNRPIIPILLQPCEIPPALEYQLADLQWVDFAEDEFEAALADLLRALDLPAPEPPAGEPRSGANVQRVREVGEALLHSDAPLARPVPPPPPQEIGQILPGSWVVEIRNQYTGTTEQANVELTFDGQFQGQLVGPFGQVALQGRWMSGPMNQLTLQGQGTNGFQVMPYFAVIQFAQVSQQSLSGVTAGGEMVAWQRVG